MHTNLLRSTVKHLVAEGNLFLSTLGRWPLTTTVVDDLQLVYYFYLHSLFVILIIIAICQLRKMWQLHKIRSGKDKGHVWGSTFTIIFDWALWGSVWYQYANRCASWLTGSYTAEQMIFCAVFWSQVLFPLHLVGELLLMVDVVWWDSMLEILE